MRKSLIVILFIFSLIQTVVAQQPAYFLFGQEQFEGIDIYNIIQDHNHNYWFATDQGIYVHDGYHFKKVECDEMKAHSVFNFAIDSKGIIYCSNLSQQVFKIENGICKLIFDIPDTGMDLHVMVNQQDELYISTSKKVYVLDSNHHLIHSPKIPEGFLLGPPFLAESGNIIQHLSNDNRVLSYKNKSSRLITLKDFKTHLGEDDGLHFFKIGNSFISIEHLNKDIYGFNPTNFSLSKKNIKLEAKTALLRYYSVNNSLWVSNNISGVFVLDQSLTKTHQSDKIFNDFFISYVFQDHEGNILLATFDQGIIVIPDMKIMDNVSEFSDYKITRITKGNSNELFFGTRDGGVLKYDGKLQTISQSSNKSIEFLFYWPKNEIVLDDTKGLSVHDLRNNKHYSLTKGSLKDAIQINDEQLLLALNSGVFLMDYDYKTHSFNNGVHYIDERSYCVSYEKSSNGYYVSTSSGLRYSNDNSEYKLLKYKGKTINVFDLVSYRNNTYAASSRQGVLVLQNGKVVKNITPQYKGEALTLFKFIISKDKIYANTQVGLVILNMEGEIINYLNKSNGLTANKIIDFALFNDQIWVTHAKGVQRFNIEEISSNVKKPEILLKSIFINNREIENLNVEGEFESKQRNFKFIFQVPTLRHRENIRYHFKLKGNNKEWTINNYENNTIEYNALAPGNYKFILKAENNGVFSETIVYSFKISAPYYQSWWFISLMTLLCIIIISFVYLRQLNIHKKKALQVNELNASRLTAIQSQMNPHFIFNSLNSIQDLVLKGDIDNSYTYITTFSNLVRRTLSYSDKDFIDFEQEIKLIELYLSLEKLRFKQDLVYCIHTNEIDDIKIPPMLIQPFIENALVHGLLHKEGVKNLKVEFTLCDVLICEISDNGIGREKAQEIKQRQGSSHESFAVNAIKRRFNILVNHYKGQLGFEINDILEDEQIIGTKVTLRIPIQQKF